MNDVAVFHQDYKRYFTEEFEARSVRDPSYSMRTFAQDLGIAVSTLTEIIRGRYGLSRSRALEVGRRLNLTPEESAHLADLIIMKNARSRLERDQAAVRVRERTSRDIQPLTVDAFKAISEWYHVAIVELATIQEFRSDADWIAARLGLAPAVVHEAVERLKRLDVLEAVGNRLKVTGSFSDVGKTLPADSTKKFQKQILEKAIAAMDFRSPEERDIKSQVFAMARKDVPAAKREIDEFRLRFQNKFEISSVKDDVLCLGIQFFSLLKP